MHRNTLLEYSEINNELIKFLEYDLIGSENEIKELENDIYFSHLKLSEIRDKLSVGKLKQIINKERYRYHIISVEAISAKIAAFVARDRRIDAVRISSRSLLKIFNLKYARRLEENDKFVILDISVFFDKLRASSIRQLIRIVDVMKKTNVKFIITNNPRTSSDLRTYRSLQAIGKIIGLGSNQTSDLILRERISLNRKRIDKTIPFVGVEIVEEIEW